MKACEIHGAVKGGRCVTCNRDRARKYFYEQRGDPMPDKFRSHWVPGSPCYVCKEPVLSSDDKHSAKCAHRWCSPADDAWREGDPCRICDKPITLAEKHSKFKFHRDCMAKQKAATLKRTAARRKAKNAAKPKKQRKSDRIAPRTTNPTREQQAWKDAGAPTPRNHTMPPKYIGPRTDQPAETVVNPGVPITRLPSAGPVGLRDMFGAHGAARLATDDWGGS